MTRFSTHTTLRSQVPHIPFECIKDTILGRQYELSLVLIGDKLSTRLNTQYKNQHTPANVLSFPLSETEGELFINARRAEREAPRFNHSFREHVAYLYIHGCLHLSGLNHGPRMETREQELLATVIS